MKAEEAKDIMQGKMTCMELETSSWTRRWCDHDCDNCEYCYAQGNFGERKEALKLAIEALEKQIPKKPDFEGDGYWDGELVYDTWICPCCEKKYEVDYEEYDYCPNCGQNLDWREQNEQ